MVERVDDLRIASIRSVTTPIEILEEMPCTAKASELVARSRVTFQNILRASDPRLAVIAGPCSIHDPEAAFEYAARLKRLCDELQRDLFVIMRVYFEKPRTVVGWKGLINDPNLDGSFQINHGLRMARQLLLRLSHLGLPAGTEYLEMITPQYINDLITWGAIGARTTESQVHRELASGLSFPVGFKNGTSGSVQVAIDAIRSAAHPHHFLSLRKEGTAAIFSTMGNDDCHLILRGGGGRINYDEKSVTKATAALKSAGLPERVMIDFSHANSEKEFKRQMMVCDTVSEQISSGDKSVFGIMLESNLFEGRQDVREGEKPVYGKSITDPCLGWEDSERVLRQLAAASRKRMEQHGSAS